MDDALTIRYRNGTITLNMLEFFPASQKDIRLLFSKVIEEIIWFEDKEKAVKKILAWLKEHQDAKDKLKELADRFASLESDLSVQEAAIDKRKKDLDAENRASKLLPAKERSKFKAEHVMPAKKRLEEMKECAAWIKKEMREVEKAFHALEKNTKRIRENILLIESLAAERMP